MPHQCTDCGRVFPDGSKEMLSGCPDCGGNTFQFLPEDSATSEESTADSATPEPESAGATDATEEPAGTRNAEDSAQAAARSSVVDTDDLPSTESEPDSAPEADDEADLTRLRDELNDQFESITIVDHGQYELDLMELYNREELIIALRENGRYVIEMPESLRGGSEN